MEKQDNQTHNNALMIPGVNKTHSITDTVLSLPQYIKRDCLGFRQALQFYIYTLLAEGSPPVPLAAPFTRQALNLAWKMSTLEGNNMQ